MKYLLITLMILASITLKAQEDYYQVHRLIQTGDVEDLLAKQNKANSFLKYGFITSLFIAAPAPLNLIGTCGVLAQATGSLSMIIINLKLKRYGKIRR